MPHFQDGLVDIGRVDAFPVKDDAGPDDPAALVLVALGVVLIADLLLALGAVDVVEVAVKFGHVLVAGLPVQGVDVLGDEGRFLIADGRDLFVDQIWLGIREVHVLHDEVIKKLRPVIKGLLAQDDFRGLTDPVVDASLRPVVGDAGVG